MTLNQYKLHSAAGAARTVQISSSDRLYATNSRRVGMSTPYTFAWRTGGLALARYTCD